MLYAKPMVAKSDIWAKMAPKSVCDGHVTQLSQLWPDGIPKASKM